MADKPTICFVDDDVNELRRFARAFAERFHVITGTSAEECLEALRQQGRRCRLWVLDLYFPRPGVTNTAGQRQEMNERFAQLAARQREFEAYLEAIGQGPAGGLEILRRVRELTPGVPVMFLTRKGTLRDAIGCRDAGASDVVLKPMPPTSDASVEALDRAMLQAAQELGDRFERLMEQPCCSSRAVPVVALAIGIAIGLVVGILVF